MADEGPRKLRVPPIPPPTGPRPATPPRGVPPRLPDPAPPTQTGAGSRPPRDAAPPTQTGPGRRAPDAAARRLERTEIDPRAPQTEPAATPAGRVRITPGLRIGEYELIRELGRGGMGQVFLARDTKLGRRVAIKFLLAPSQRFTSRFHVEARATARVSFEHIVTIYVTGEHEGMPYMVLEYVEGKTLAQLIADKRVPVGRAVELIVPVVRALERAHAENIVHRDLKPDNIIVTASGTVKVLDFGVAKLFASEDEDSARRPRPPSWPGDLEQTRNGAIVGTLPYMSPEQLGMDEVDHRSDLWAVGIILYQMIAGHHPLDPLTQGRLFGAAAALDDPMPSLSDDVPGLPDRLVEAVARCLAKRKDQRYASATELLAALEPLLPTRAGKSLTGDESPYPGLHAFQEADANRFFGRGKDIAALIARLRDHPLVGIVGPSGVGKSSFVRAGVVPALKISGEAWEVMIVRPGRNPLAALASAMESLRETRDSDPVLDRGDPAQVLRAEPGVFGARLRARARRRRAQILVFVDQHEELYTMVHDPAERRAFTACLAGAGDDPSGPIRIVISMRADFLDRAAEDRRFVGELTGGLVFLQPLGREGLQEALVAPLEALGYSFEPGVVPAMLDALEATPGALPLLQFSAARLWDLRDRSRRVLTRDAYLAMGGVAGALATHADEVLAALPAPDQHVVRGIFQRLVTPERTRAIVDASELRVLSPEVDRLLAHLVSARLLVMQKRGDDGSVEIVHESLIRSWPRLARWLDENQEDAAYLAQLGGAARQWDAKGRPPGLLWRDEAMQEAKRWHARYAGELPEREQAFLDAVFAQARRTKRAKRALQVAALSVLSLGVVGLSISNHRISASERAAQQAAVAAKAAQDEAVKNARAAKDAEQHAEAERLKAVELQRKADKQRQLAEQAYEDLLSARHQTQLAVRAQSHAEQQAEAAEQAKAKAEAERRQHMGQITNVLK